MEVGIRELRDGLSAFLERVKHGETIEVTDRGRPVARIIPAGIPAGLAELIAEGKVAWGGEYPRPPKRLIKLPPGPLVSDYIIEDRP